MFLDTWNLPVCLDLLRPSARRLELWALWQVWHGVWLEQRWEEARPSYRETAGAWLKKRKTGVTSTKLYFNRLRLLRGAFNHYYMWKIKIGLLQHCLYLQTMLKLKCFVPQGFTVFFFCVEYKFRKEILWSNKVLEMGNGN